VVSRKGKKQTNLANAEGELEGLVAVARAVELAAVHEL